VPLAFQLVLDEAQQVLLRGDTETGGQGRRAKYGSLGVVCRFVTSSSNSYRRNSTSTVSIYHTVTVTAVTVTHGNGKPVVTNNTYLVHTSAVVHVRVHFPHVVKVPVRGGFLFVELAISVEHHLRLGKKRVSRESTGVLYIPMYGHTVTS
jgi:hypothetical protein